MATQKLFYLLILISLEFLCGFYTHDFNQDPQIQNFINKMTTQHHFDRQYLTHVFSSAVFQPEVIQSVITPAEKKPWGYYRKILVTPKHVRQGIQFWQLHASTLKSAEKKYGIPASVIVGILGAETEFGQTQGDFRVLDSLSTLAFYYPKQAYFFQSELEQFFLLVRENHWNIDRTFGSYAGAMGQAQFMPSSYRHYAVDTNQKGYSDLFTNADDAIFSIANYLKIKGWHNGKPITKRLDKQSPPQKNLVLTLQNETMPEDWLIFPNFKVIMTYNSSVLYAMAVYQLGEEIKKNYLKISSHPRLRGQGMA